MIFLTGASGYVGGQLLARLVQRGEKVRCLVLPDDPRPPQPSTLVEVVRGDVTDLASFRSQGSGVSAIVHCAALMLPNPPAEVWRVNVSGTEAMIGLAEQWGIRRFVYLSAVSAAYPVKNVYGRAKSEAERLVASSELDYTILRPTMIYGEGGGLHFSTLVSTIARIPVALPVLGPGTAKLQPVWIGDVVQAVELALREERAIRRTFDVSGETVVTMNELVELLCAAMGRRRVRVNLPIWLCRPIARVVAWLRPNSFLTPDALLGLSQDATLDYGPFAQACGYKPIGLAEALPHACAACLRPQNVREAPATLAEAPRDLG